MTSLNPNIPPFAPIVFTSGTTAVPALSEAATCLDHAEADSNIDRAADRSKRSTEGHNSSALADHAGDLSAASSSDLSAGDDPHVCGSESLTPEDDASDEQQTSASLAASFVREYFEDRNLEVRFDGSFVIPSMPTVAANYSEVPHILSRLDITFVDILDEMVLGSTISGHKIKKHELQSALRREIRQRQQRRYAFVLGRVIVDGASDLQTRADEEWARLATIFNMNASLCIGVLKHFIWQVKRKVMCESVTHHLMPILFSQIQGSGKSTFARRFLAPIEELASDPVTLSDFADTRSGDIYRYPVVLIDDIDMVTDSQTAVLKSVMTNPKIRRRNLGTSMSTAYRQNSTLFGTANHDISVLVDDHTGHRRFAMLPFRNGSVEKDGSPDVWQTVDSLDYSLLWQSVESFADSPIKQHLDALAKHQGVSRPDPVKDWLTSLKKQSDAFRSIQVEHGVQARDLYDLMCAQTDIELSEVEFGKRMRRLIKDPATLFDSKKRTKQGYYYKLRK